jgi:hypothetical protein
MTENDKAWQRNTPEQRAQRRANWESWAQKQSASPSAAGTGCLSHD